MDLAAQRDYDIRQEAFRFLDGLVAVHGDSLPWAALLQGLIFQGERVPLLSQQGIFKPKALPRLPLSIRTAAVRPGEPRPYDDGLFDDGTVLYRYRGTEPSFYQNVWLREAMRAHAPLVYFHGTVPGRYVAAWPVFVIGDDPARLTFRIDVDAREWVVPPDISPVPERFIEKRYAMRLTRQRLHQGTFRDRVLAAYRKQCAICHLRQVKLLDAAHILPDAEQLGEPRVSNGLTLCKLHHGAYDADIMGIRPDLIIEVRQAVLDERDGPMLLHGLQGIHGQRAWSPRSPDRRPDRDALEQRYEKFRRTA